MLSINFHSIALLFVALVPMVSAAPQSIPITGLLSGQGMFFIPLRDPTIIAHRDKGTWYEQGLGACGVLENDSEFVVAIGHALFDAYP